MRNRWQLFTSNVIVFMAWYFLFYCLSAGGWGGLPTALLWALGALVAGGVIGVLIGAGAHALELHAIHRDVRAGDARDGARITLGKLPEQVARQPDPPAPPVAETPATAPASLPEPAPSAAEKPGVVEPTSGAAPMPVSVSRLATECASFTRDHEAVRVLADGAAGGATGALDRARDPADFAAFLDLIGRLSAEGVDVSGVRVSQDADGVPAGVTFPISTEQNEVQP